MGRFILWTGTVAIYLATYLTFVYLLPSAPVVDLTSIATSVALKGLLVVPASVISVCVMHVVNEVYIKLPWRVCTEVMSDAVGGAGVGSYAAQVLWACAGIVVA